MGPTAEPAPVPLSAEVGPQDPQERFLAVAAKADSMEGFRPTPVHEKLAEHLFTSQASSFADLVEASGVHRTSIWRTLQDPKACAWICARATEAVKFGLGAVHSRLLQMALTSRSPAFMKLYLERFDPDYSSRVAEGGTTINAQYAMIQAMSPKELEAFVSLKRRQEGVFVGANKSSGAVPAREEVGAEAPVR